MKQSQDNRRRRGHSAAEHYREYIARDGIKRCATCKVDKPITEYRRDWSTSDSLAWRCVTCQAAEKAGRARYQKAYPATNPEKASAHRALDRAIRDGLIRRPSACSACDAECTPHGHHDDYAKPLEVRWLCAACHRAHHWKGV